MRMLKMLPAGLGERAKLASDLEDRLTQGPNPRSSAEGKL